MTSSLALCFDAPMQSWGTRSRATIRDTGMEPTKSGVVGLLAAASGVEREDDAAIAELARLRMAVRVDREGILERDFHTTQNVPTTLGTGHRTIVSERYYLADALFLVVLEGERARLARLAEAIAAPVWRLCFGRRAFVPARPLLAPDAHLFDAPAAVVVREHPWLETSPRTRRLEREKADRPGLRVVSDCPPDARGAETRHDHPLSFNPADRRFATRTVLTEYVQLTDGMITAGDPSCS
ncbi:type I-E CRISPR-associated protein Cas5/CasD [Actinokineospora sp. NPDC004072]